MTTPTTEARVEGTLDPMLDDIREEANTWADLADIEDGPLGGNVVKAATYRGTATGLKMAEQIIMQHMSNSRPHAEERSDDSVQADVRFCPWAWDEAEQRWLTGCGYAFLERRPDHPRDGAFLPFPFCPYCGAQIRKPNTELSVGAKRHTLR